MANNKKTGKTFKSFSDEEREAMKDRIKELNETDGEKALLKKIDTMQGPDRVMAKRLHEIITKNAPALSPKTWYGMPAYANKDGKVVCFFRDAGKFKERYAMLGFNDSAKLDEGQMWSVAYALKKLTPVEEKKIIALLKKAVN